MLTLINRYHLLPLAAVALVSCVSTAPVPSTTSPAITEADLRHRLFLIADDSMMGRETGSEGAYKTAEYIASEFRRLGLEPAGENGSYFQTVPFWRAAVDPASRLTIGQSNLEVGRDFVPASVFAQGRVLDAVPAIFAGSVTDSSRWISAEQAAGKVVVLEVPGGLRGVQLMNARWRDAVALAPIVI